MSESPPVGRDAVRAELIASALQLFADHGWADVSVRAIADHAGVNHALIYRHFGSKQGLLQAVLLDLTQSIAAAATSDRDQVADSATGERDAYARILARILLEGSFEELDEAPERPVARWLTELARDNDLPSDRSRQLMATATALELGWRLYGPVISQIAQLSDDVDMNDLIDDSLSETILALMSRWGEANVE